jgi:hypothetical protein
MKPGDQVARLTWVLLVSAHLTLLASFIPDAI